MFRRDSTTQKPDRLDTVIGKDALFKGILTCETGLRVDGRIEGEIQSSGDIVIGEGALVVANVHARNVLVAGEIRGNLKSTGRLEITQKGRVSGDINVNSLVIAEGGMLEGKSEMKTGEVKGSEPKASKAT